MLSKDEIVAAVQEALSTRDASLAARDTEVAALQAQVDELMPHVCPDPAAHRSARTTILGLSAKQGEWSQQLANVGPGIGARRIFCDLGDGAESKGALIRQAIADKQMPVLSYKIGNDLAGALSGKLDAVATATGKFLASLGVEIRFVVFHEPNGDLSGADFVALNRRLVPLMKSARVKAGSFINGWLLESREREFAAYVPDSVLEVWDWWGIDAYHAGSMTNPDPVNTPGRRIQNFVNYAARRGVTKPIGIGEYNGFTDTAIRDAGEVILASDLIEFACMWSSQIPGATDFRLTGARLEAFKQTLADPRVRREQGSDEPPPPRPRVVVYGPLADRTPPTEAYVTPEQHGARGDGVANDTAAFQAALNAAAGGILWLPKDKTYNIHQTISVRSNTRVMGAGPTSVVRFRWTGAASTNGSVNLRTGGSTSSNIHLSNFVLEGGGDGLPGGIKVQNPEGLVPLLKLIKLDNFSVKNMELRNAEGLTISYTGSTNGVFQHNWVHHSGRDGITGYRNMSANVTDIVVDSNLIEKCGDDYIAINGLVPGHNLTAEADGASPLPKRVTITNNVLRGWETDPNGMAAGRGIALNGVAGVLVENNQLWRPNGTGILLTGCNSHICSGSSTDWHSENAQILNNKIEFAQGGSRPGAIVVIKTKNSTIAGNRASSSAPYNFSGAVSCVVSDNTQ